MFSSKNITTPIGEMLAIRTEKGLCLLEFLDGKTTEKQLKELGDIDEIIEAENDILLNNLEQELKLYFEGNLKEFKTPIDFIGTDFQKKVWEELVKIPFGETRSYKAQSIAVGDILAIRAVANANGKNKISILVPCHRVIGSDGSLTGFAGGKHRKQFLLELESNQIQLF
ncbi:methylated-DNA-[protein]-cysteine S-methyltransferase/AraC family transcriptional regulator, regulatory protein of adaptative response / methylated-DNA-[protein]-cysteine methyltransferase [Algoriella xinjiangensis]|uniref:methylated-DNA--[protein]-cysteine S-methyltransferase n=1 Tax=Algoriella xinjiangensis TaxID=684065 RepID=A0A1I4TBM7_9FLAO|nr:methylated-DNA--[protein]-cysteine S-methyltransferase [Algoriella xinjiangensis]SFM73987.1 methylated-DNA-[protein]-cysteine S-methyltransferase/AraC family transcriptional regulator, regulatory protein of adaptative response / methylated-DNA-[protein]-cysteine methyltransferase [Algoriella xinjiangensis]VDH15028.1 Methylated-DNA--protein-cysteine methyltransferase, constitutive [Algoriella xinjiangensis]